MTSTFVLCMNIIVYLHTILPLPNNLWFIFMERLFKYFFIRDCGSTLYVGLQHAVPPTNTKFKHYFSRLKRVCRTQTLTSTEHHISSQHSHFRVQLSAGSPFLLSDKNRKFLRFFIINIITRHSVEHCTLHTDGTWLHFTSLSYRF